MSELYTGRIIKALAGFYYVKRYTDNEVYACRARGIFRKRGHSPLVGDVTDFVVTHEGDKEGNIESIHERSSVLSRPTVANVDLALLVFALKDPVPNLHLLDRMLVALEYAGLEVVICFNKRDLVDEETIAEYSHKYDNISYPVVCISGYDTGARSKLMPHLSGHLTTVCGPSGAGKSSLINLLTGRETMEVGAVSEKIKRGKQTTRHVELSELYSGDGTNCTSGTYIVDTPGFSSLDLDYIQKESLGMYFPEIGIYEDECKFNSCSHIYEALSDCAVKRALDAGRISDTRYESYRLFYEELSQKKRYGS